VDDTGEHACNPVSELERQVERGSMFTQVVGAEVPPGTVATEALSSVPGREADQP
jgi:hypothetical protein